jgi:hypothetical protein
VYKPEEGKSLNIVLGPFRDDIIKMENTAPDAFK